MKEKLEQLMSKLDKKEYSNLKEIGAQAIDFKCATIEELKGLSNCSTNGV